MTTLVRLDETEERSFVDRKCVIIARPLLPVGLLEAVREASLRRLGEIRNGRPIEEWFGLRDVSPETRELTERCGAVARRLAKACRQRDPVCYFDHLIIKKSHPESGLSWHQDLAFSRFGLHRQGFHFWIPLVDVDGSNGGIAYAPEVDPTRLHRHERSVNGRFEMRVEPSPSVYSATIPAGGFAVHSPLSVHGSAPNLSGLDRPAWVLRFGPGPAAQVISAGARLRASVRSLG